MIKDVECFLKCLSTILDSSVESSVFRSVPHFYCIICSFDEQFLEYFVYFGDQSSVQCGVGEDLSPLCRLPFCVVDGVLWFTEAFQFQEVPFIVSFCVCGTGVVFRMWSPVPMRSKCTSHSITCNRIHTAFTNTHTHTYTHREILTYSFHGFCIYVFRVDHLVLNKLLVCFSLVKNMSHFVNIP